MVRKYQKVDVKYFGPEDSEYAQTFQFSDKNEAIKFKEKNGFDCFKVVAEYKEYIVVIFGNVTKYYDEYIEEGVD